MAPFIQASICLVLAHIFMLIADLKSKLKAYSCLVFMSMCTKTIPKIYGSLFSGFESGSLFDTCPGAPSHSEAMAADTRSVIITLTSFIMVSSLISHHIMMSLTNDHNGRLIIWLDHADTDLGCTKREKDIVNYGAFQCLESERAKIEADIRTLFLRRSTLQENMCQVLRYKAKQVQTLNLKSNLNISQ